MSTLGTSPAYCLKTEAKKKIMELGNEEIAAPAAGRVALRVSAVVAATWLVLATVVGLILFQAWPQVRDASAHPLFGLWVVVAAPLGLIVLTGAVGLTVHRLVDVPLANLVTAARRIARSDYDTPVPLEGATGFSDLAHRLNRVRAAIRAKTEALDESGRLFQTMFEQVPCYISVQDRDFKLVACNKMFEDEFGQNLGEYCYRAYKGRDSMCPECSVDQTFRDGRVHRREEVVRSVDGAEIHFLNVSAPIKDSQDNIVAVMEMATDVTALRELEVELRKSEEKYRLFFNNDPSPILVLDRRTFEVLDVNDQAVDKFGYSHDAMLTMAFPELTDPADRQAVKDFFNRGGRFLERVRQIRADGSQFFINLRAAYGHFDQRPVIFTSTADITRQIESDQQLIQAAKMATLGEMSAGVAHEINQPLCVIGTGANFLVKQARRGGDIDARVASEVAGEMVDQVERATRIIGHLREFGRKSEVTTDLVNVNRPIENAFMILGQQLKVHDIMVRTNLEQELPPVAGDVNRLEQVFINLILNARDAIETRREANLRVRDGYIQIRSWRDGDRVKISVADNGVGIPADQADRIFEPFYTTKEVGKGTGLGLSISYGIVRDFGGEITVESEPGMGTTFTLSFPATDNGDAR